MRKVNEQLRKLLHVIPQQYICEKTGLMQPQVSRWLNGDDFKTYENLNRIAGMAYMEVVPNYDELLEIVKRKISDLEPLKLQEQYKVSFKTFYSLKSNENVKFSLSTLVRISGVELSLKLK